MAGAIGEIIKDGVIAAGRIGSAMEGIHDAYDAATDTWHHVRDDYDSIRNGVNSLNSNSSINSGSMSVPSAAPRESRKRVINTALDAVNRKKQRTFVSNRKKLGGATAVNVSSVASNPTYFDSHLLLTSGEQSLTPLNVDLGKQLYPDVISPFLKCLNGKGKVRMAFGGRCLSNPDRRHTHFQLFRHNLSAAPNPTPAAWPTLLEPYILSPGNPELFQPKGGTAVAATSYAIGRTSMREIKNGVTYYAPYNISDLEDLSWNLNKLKLGSQAWAASNVPVSFENQVDLYRNDRHARMSTLYSNNSAVADLPQGGAQQTSSYQYNAVFHKGNIHYQFMNKGTAGAKVELIVYRMKKNAANPSATAANLSNDPSYTNKLVTGPISQGYLDTVLEDGATDALNGRTPSLTDVYDSAYYPLLPKLKKTKQINQPLVEVTRQCFAMPSGSRREVNFKLPGEVYNPVHQASKNANAASGINSASPPILHEHMYGIYVSVSGVPSTQAVTPDVSGNPNDEYYIADAIGTANVQFYCTYTEHMGACQYADSTERVLYTKGALIAPGIQPATNFSSKTVVMLPADHAVRLPPTVTTGGVTEGGNALHTNLVNGTPTPPP